MSDMTHWRKILESEYLAAADLDDGNGNFIPRVFTIKSASQEKVREVGTNKEELCLLLHFSDHKKPMICNVTNAKVISKVAGSPYIEEWAGKRITIGTEKVKAFGELWDALRVKTTAPKPTTAAPVQTIPLCSDCGQEITAHEGAAASRISAATSEKYGRPLCFDCSVKAKAALEAGSKPMAEQIGMDGATNDA